ncbi:hypothetical protein K2173_005819 [Erythroxylum novogranatense]|uniref:Uncharacterized protein n=1 Tax=Erythroxylum novogranatense TaxID=1862640 RepID=A0AAV8U5J2_9ROSI|nr:hypothetical protein K2173_005819 [Erythroxylum novogranatense]
MKKVASHLAFIAAIIKSKDKTLRTRVREGINVSLWNDNWTPYRILEGKTKLQPVKARKAERTGTLEGDMEGRDDSDRNELATVITSFIGSEKGKDLYVQKDGYVEV